MIIALQRAAATPSELTKQNLYDATESLAEIYFEFMAEYYGERYAMLPVDPAMAQAMQLMGQEVPERTPQLFDFNTLKQHPLFLKLDVGASTYYSEIASMTTLDKLLQLGVISKTQYVERVSDDYIPKRRELLSDFEREEAMQQQMMMMQQAAMPPPAEASGSPGPPAEDMSDSSAIPTGGGYAALQRKINETGTTAGLI